MRLLHIEPGAVIGFSTSGLILHICPVCQGGSRSTFYESSGPRRILGHYTPFMSGPVLNNTYYSHTETSDHISPAPATFSLHVQGNYISRGFDLLHSTLSERVIYLTVLGKSQKKSFFQWPCH